MDYLPMLTQVTQLLSDWVPPVASVAVSNQQQYVLYRAGSYDLHIFPGEPIPSGSIASQVLQLGTRIESRVDANVFGVPYYGLGYPLLTEEGLQGALTVILPPGYRSTRESLAYVTGQSEEVWRPIPVEQIAYFESAQKKTWFHTSNHTFTTPFSLQELEQRLSVKSFLRVHRSFVVNIAFIDFIDRDVHSNLIIRLTHPGGTRIPVSQTYLRHVRLTLGF